MSDGAITKLFGLLPELFVDADFWKGLLLGLQEKQDDETTKCIESYEVLFALL